MFLKCLHVALFWNEFLDWWSQVTTGNFKVPDSTLSYWPTNALEYNQSLSLALPVAKHFIYKMNVTWMTNLYSSDCLRLIQLGENIMTGR